MLLGEEKMSPEDIATVIMDMLLIGVNTVSKVKVIRLEFAYLAEG